MRSAGIIVRIWVFTLGNKKSRRSNTECSRKSNQNKIYLMEFKLFLPFLLCTSAQQQGSHRSSTLITSASIHDYDTPGDIHMPMWINCSSMMVLFLIHIAPKSANSASVLPFSEQKAISAPQPFS